MSLSHSPKIVTSGLVLYLDAANTKSYAGTGTSWLDISGNNNTATLVSSPTYSSTDPKYFSFDASGKRATIGTPFGQAGQTTITIGYRRTEASSSTTWRTLLSDVSANFHHLVSQQSSRNLGIWDGSFKDFGYNPPQDSKFHIYSVVYTSGSSATLYIDGVQGNTIATTLNLNTYKIGSIGNWTGTYWSGDISFLQIHSYGLTASEIKQNYDALRGRYSL